MIIRTCNCWIHILVHVMKIDRVNRHVHAYVYTYTCINSGATVMTSANYGVTVLAAAYSSTVGTATGRSRGGAYSPGSSARRTHTAEGGSSDS